MGTSSWKYPGWRGQLYDEEKYVTRGKFSESRFNRECLAEYADVFKTVCVDAAYYKFPDHRYLESMASQVPADFLFGFKVTDEITIKKFTNLPRFGLRAGKPNENFLNADLFAKAFLGPCEEFKQKVGLHAEYFGALERHGVAHVFNSWAGMPPVTEQLAVKESRTHPNLCAARFLLKPGRQYEESVRLFEPYDKIKEPNPDARSAGAVLVKEGVEAGGKRKTFIYVNNRLEGNALDTIDAMLGEAGWSG